MDLPFSNRKDSMYLSTISKDEVLGRQKVSIETRNIMSIDDIHGSKP